MLTSFQQEQVQVDHQYEALEKLIAERISLLQYPLFQTNVIGLWEVWKGKLPQHYNCRTCIKFIADFGGLLDANGRSALWQVDGVPHFFIDTIRQMRDMVEKSQVVGVFYADHPVWGSKVKGKWTHLHGENPAFVSTEPNKDTATKRENYDMLVDLYQRFPRSTFTTVIRVLDHLKQNDKHMAMAKWLLEWHGKNPWLAAACCPVGFAHAKNGALGQLLEAIKENCSFEEIVRRWTLIMDPMKYMRPEVVKQGTIDRAERIFEEKGYARSLQRKRLPLEEVKAIWRPWKSPSRTFMNVVGATTGRTSSGLPMKTMTWAKFMKTVQPKFMEIMPPSRGVYTALVGPLHKDAPRITKWDNECTHYMYKGGSESQHWNLRRVWTPVIGLCDLPEHWEQPELKRLLFLIEGCRDLRYIKGGLFFPDDLRSDLHEVRSVMEAYSQNSILVGEGVAGLLHSDEVGIKIRVDGQEYFIDRLE